MGLDIVEIVMEIEDKSEISVPDEEVSECRKVGDLIGLVAARAGGHESDVCRSSR